MSLPADDEAALWAVLPAAGSGSRMGSDVPKQYLELAGASVIEHSLGVLLAHPRMRAVAVVLDRADQRWASLPLSGDPRLRTCTGGAERFQSVYNGLLALAGEAAESDWVLVHDAARPCLHPELLARLVNRLRGHPVGGLLAIPVNDTIKRADADAAVLETVPRDRLWCAQTPQMFRFGLLRQALAAVIDAHRVVTDECAAVERLGHKPLLVEGSPANLKITRPQDLGLASYYLQRDRAQPGPRVASR